MSIRNKRLNFCWDSVLVACKFCPVSAAFTMLYPPGYHHHQVVWNTSYIRDQARQNYTKLLIINWLFNIYIGFFRKNFYSVSHRSPFLLAFCKNLYCAGLLLNYLMSALQRVLCVSHGTCHANFNFAAKNVKVNIQHVK